MKEIAIPSEFKPLFEDNWREAAIYGGRFSLKSHTEARYLLIRARMAKTRVACFREFQSSIAESSHQLLSDLIKLYELNDFVVKDNSIINNVTGSDFLFKGLWNNEQSIKSIEGIDIAWVEEAQKHGFLSAVIVDEIEDDKKNRPALFRHKWLGEPNTSDQKIYTDWAILDAIPHEARLERIGLDFGYTNDPSAIVAIYYYNGGYILDEILFQKGLSNKQIAETLLNQRKVLVIADSAEPKSIDEIRAYGVNVQSAVKGKDSVRQGIQSVQDQRISVTKQSVNIIKEYRNYLWETDREGRILNEPEHLWSHSMDAIRYAMSSLVPMIQRQEMIANMPRYQHKEIANPAR